MSLELYRNGSVYSPADPFATAMLVEDDTVAWIGTEAAAGALLDARMTEIDLQGALITPAFVDSHIHLGELGAALNGLKLGSANNAAELLDAVASAAAGTTGIIRGTGWDESTFATGALPTPEELQQAAPDREVYLSRVDVHSALISPKLARRLGLVEGPEFSHGVVTGNTHGIVRAAVLEHTEENSTENLNLALAHLAATGHGTVVEMASPNITGRAALEQLLARSDAQKATTPDVFAFWSQAVSSEQEAKETISSFSSQAVVGLGGDLNVDGSIGSRTALLRADYSDAPGERGASYLDVEQIAAHVAACSLAGIQASFHVIGDAGLDLTLDGFAKAVEMVGLAKVQAGRHRLEHVEMVDDAARNRMLGFALTASMQPGFDAAWGGAGRLYEQRLGNERSASMNGVGQFLSAGVPVVIGSDAPVTRASPWAAVKACLELSDPTARISARAAFMAHTRSGFRALGVPHPLAGQLLTGADATFAIWDAAQLSVQTPDLRVSSWSTDARAGTPMLPVLDEELPNCLRTVRSGQVLFDALGVS